MILRLKISQIVLFRATGTYEDMRTSPHHVFGFIGGKSGLYGYMLLQTGKVRNYQNTDEGNQVQLTYVLDHPIFRAPFAPENNNCVQTKYA